MTQEITLNYKAKDWILNCLSHIGLDFFGGDYLSMRYDLHKQLLKSYKRFKDADLCRAYNEYLPRYQDRWGKMTAEEINAFYE